MCFGEVRSQVLYFIPQDSVLQSAIVVRSILQLTAPANLALHFFKRSCSFLSSSTANKQSLCVKMDVHLGPNSLTVSPRALRRLSSCKFVRCLLFEVADLELRGMFCRFED